MSVLNRYSNAEKYQGVLRDFCNCQILNDKGKPGLFLKDEILTRIGWTGKVSDFTGAEEYEHMYNCLLYTSPSPRDLVLSRMPSSA